MGNTRGYKKQRANLKKERGKKCKKKGREEKGIIKDVRKEKKEKKRTQIDRG